jgi:hypothetical protein
METIESLHDRLDALEKQTQALTRAAERQVRWWRILACGSVVLSVTMLPLVGGTAQEQSMYERAMARRLAALEYKLQYIDGGPNEVVITGANLRIVNGLGSTDTTNGLGNLIVGYNELRMQSLPFCAQFPPPPVCTDARTGSHNIVAGRQNNFSRYGGLVVGFLNEISSPFASVSGGFENTASGPSASVSGGDSNVASGDEASVSGGFRNAASGGGASISGGQENTAGNAASVSGGLQNTASGNFSSVSGGRQRMAPGENNWAAGPLFAAQ